MHRPPLTVTVLQFICVQFNNLKASSIIAPVCLALKLSLLTKVAMNVWNTHHLSTRTFGVLSPLLFEQL